MQEKREHTIAIAGTCYVGLSLAVLLALQARPEMMAGPVPRREKSLSTA